jgi:hypothetical protein
MTLHILTSALQRTLHSYVILLQLGFFHRLKVYTKVQPTLMYRHVTSSRMEQLSFLIFVSRIQNC